MNIKFLLILLFLEIQGNSLIPCLYSSLPLQLRWNEFNYTSAFQGCISQSSGCDKVLPLTSFEEYEIIGDVDFMSCQKNWVKPCQSSSKILGETFKQMLYYPMFRSYVDAGFPNSTMLYWSASSKHGTYVEYGTINTTKNHMFQSETYVNSITALPWMCICFKY